MSNPSRPSTSRLATGRAHAAKLYGSHRLRKALPIALAAIALFGVFGFLAAPSILKSQLQRRASAALGRPVTVGEVHLNPYTLRLQLDKLHIGQPDDKTPFVDIDSLVIVASWASLFRGAPILDTLTVQHPQLHITRSAPQTFNFSDVIERFAARPGEPPSSPTRFAIANISVHEGDIQFDDKVQGTHHRIDRLELGIPFIANTPSRIDVFVQPLLAFRADGSPLRMDGQTKPFADSLESAMNFRFDHLDLPPYLGYVPAKLPVTVSSGKLSGQLQLHFINARDTPQLRLDGQLVLDDLKLADDRQQPLLELGSAKASLSDVEPLVSRYALTSLTLDRIALHYARLPGGRSNIDAFATPDPSTAPPSHPTQVRVDTLNLQGAQLDYADFDRKIPIKLNLTDLHGSLQGLSTSVAPAGNIDLAGQLAGGGVAVQGKLDIPGKRYTGKVAVRGVTVVPLVPLMPPLLNADIANGYLDAEIPLQASWGNPLNVHVESAQVSLNDFALGPKHSRTTPLSWKSLHAGIGRFDMAGSEARLDSLSLDGLKVDVRRMRNGRLDLMNLVAAPKPTPRTNTVPTSPFRWSIAHVAVNDAAVNYRDDNMVGKRLHVVLKASKFGIDQVSDNLHQPIKLDLNGTIGKGSYTITGSLRPQPLDADLRVKSTRLDIAPFESLISVPLNVRVVSAQLGLNGHVRYSDRGRQPARIAYQGQATLGRLRVLDKATDDEFLRWTTLTASSMNLRLGDGAPHMDIGALSLDDFYARLIVNATGRLNLQDVVASPEETAPVSVTRAQDGSTPAQPAHATSTSLAQAAPSPSAPPPGPTPEIHIGKVALARGQLNYTDNFIKPNYTANITELTGNVGAFGTQAAGPPAELNLNGQLDDNAPVDIAGSINPLAPVAFLDVKAKADGVELTHLSPYSGKYAGYPITKGRLNVDVHYLLDQGKLTADNHIFIDQLTFGDRIDGPGVSHLPVKLAVALLKDSQGRIDVHVPVSGSLNDPRFSVGGLVWHAIVNLIAKAATAPFKLLASAFGGGNGGQDLGYIEFAPGSSALTAESTARLDKVAKLLNDKPSLNLDIIGRDDPAYDEKGLRHEMVEALVRHEAGDDDDDSVSNTSSMTSEQHDRYLEKAYKHAKFKKERNLIGMTKSQPPADMQKLMEANMPVDQDALRQLAQRRADTVRQWMR
ncbi:DUF748 domain-containing protein, partial [Dyella sp.]|uniref:DUF748 domain-containing protein n=1 Tax=Dyella sp. TaxID=1869338 RepID=UPI002ED29453